MVKTIDVPSGDHEIGGPGELGGCADGKLQLPLVRRFDEFVPSALKATSQM